MQKNHDYAPLLPSLEAIAREAAALARTLRARPFDVRSKGKDGPVTAIDLAVNDFLYKKLMVLLPDAGWHSEETAEDPTWATHPHAWIVDPIDGTNHLISGAHAYAISIALVADRKPVLAAVIAPDTTALRDAPTFCANAQNAGTHVPWSGESRSEGVRSASPLEYDLMIAARGGSLCHNGTPLPTRTRPRQPPTLATPPGSRHAPFLRAHGFATRPIGSIAYRLACAATGLVDATMGLHPSVNMWDIAAGHLLAEAGGLRFTDRHGNAVEYTPGNKMDGFVAAPPGLHEKMLRFIAENITKPRS